MWRDVGIGNFIIFCVVVAIVLKGVEKEVGFSFNFSWDEQRRFMWQFPHLMSASWKYGGGRAAGVRLEYDSNMWIAPLVSS